MTTHRTAGRPATGRLKYLLVMPRLIQKTGDGYSFPLGIAYISASMKQAGFDVTTLNLNHREGDVQEILRQEIEERHIDVVATGGLSFQYATIRKVVAAVKAIDADITTIVGGGIITGDPEPAMAALEDADYGVIGEGEITMNELCRALEQRGALATIDGIIYKGEAGYTITSSRKEVEDIDSLAWPDYQGFEIDKYLQSTPPSISGLNRQNTFFMLASRSCPYNCTFCFHTIGKKYRQRSLESFFEELGYLVSAHRIEFLCLADELFARDIDRVREFCARIKKYNIRWWAQFRVDDITPELLAALKDGGCEVMSFGLESADNRVLKSMRKGTTVAHIERTLKLVYDSGISLEGAFIFGDIAETYETASNTLRWWREHSQYKITLNLITVYPGAFLYQYACQRGIIPDRVRFLKDGCPQVNVSQLTNAELSQLTRQLLEAPVTLTKPLVSAAVTSVDGKTGRIGIEGVCETCRQRNRWDDLKLFASNSISCRNCGQKYNVPLCSELRAQIETNITRLLEKHGALAIWGVNYHTADLFHKSRVLRNEHIYPVDISETKRKMDLCGSRIHPPDIIDTEGIRAVIIAVPAYFTQIASQISTHHRNVTAVVDICSLIDPEYQV